MTFIKGVKVLLGNLEDVIELEPEYEPEPAPPMSPAGPDFSSIEIDR